jgi:HK97 family phage major capsid protein
MMPEDLDSEIYKATPAFTIIRQLANIRQTDRDKVARRSITDVSMGWGKLEVGSLPTETTPTISKDYIYVEDLTGLVKIGRDELMDSDDILAGIISQAMAQKRGEVENIAFLTGRGHTYQEPDGVTLDTTIISTQTDLATADTIVPDDIITLKYKLPAAYRANASFMWASDTEAALRKVKATSNYLWVNPTGGLAGAPPVTFDGKPVYNHESMVVPASTNTDLSIVALFGNWNRGYTIVDRAGMTVQRLDELYAESGLVGFLFYFRVGGGVVRPDAFRALDNNT